MKKSILGFLTILFTKILASIHHECQHHEMIKNASIEISNKKEASNKRILETSTVKMIRIKIDYSCNLI